MGFGAAGTDDAFFGDLAVAVASSGGRDEAKGFRGESDEARSARHRGSIVPAIALRTRTCGNPELHSLLACPLPNLTCRHR